MNIEIFEDTGNQFEFVNDFVITGPVMAFAKVSTANEDTFGSVPETFENK